MAAIFPLTATTLRAQRFPERKFVRSGNTMYERGRFAESEVDYRRALEKSPESYEAAYNLAGALYKQERYQEAAELYGQVAADSTHSNTMASALYNNGNALFKQRQLEQAIEAYKSALRLNPSDEQAKFNLAYTKKLLEKDDNKDDKDNKDNKNNQDNKQDQQQQQNQQQKPDKGDQNKDKSQPQNQDQQQQPQQGGMDKQEADQMLEAVQMSEDKTREKVNEQKAKTVGRSGKNW